MFASALTYLLPKRGLIGLQKKRDKPAFDNTKTYPILVMVVMVVVMFVMAMTVLC